MTISLFADYVRDLKILLDDIDAAPETFRSFDLHIDVAHRGLLFVYETKRRMAQTASIYYARMADTGTNKQVSQQTAYGAVSAFFGMGQFVALTGNFAGADVDAAGVISGDTPSCAVAFSYRKTGMPKTLSMKMIFVGLGSDDDALAYAETTGRSQLIGTRPFRSARVWEWQ